MNKYFFWCSLTDGRATNEGIIDALGASVTEAEFAVRERVKHEFPGLELRKCEYRHHRVEQWTEFYSKQKSTA